MNDTICSCRGTRRYIVKTYNPLLSLCMTANLLRLRHNNDNNNTNIIIVIIITVGDALQCNKWFMT